MRVPTIAIGLVLGSRPRRIQDEIKRIE